MKRIIRLSLSLITIFIGIILCSCKSKSTSIKCTITRDTKYDAAILSVLPDEFDKYFSYGDSCSVEFSNGYKIEELPYHNGYYVNNNRPIIVAYPGFNNVSITYNNMGIWNNANLNEGDTVTIRLNKKGKYLAIQEALGQVYSFDRNDYSSDISFCNFRELSGGNLKENFFYRGASPVDNSRNRAPYTDGLLRDNNINFVLDLADSDNDMTRYIESSDFDSNYTKSLYENNNVALLSMSSAYQVLDYKQKLVSGLRKMMQSNGPVYIHCMEGKDRTGFVCMILEALAGASYEEMRNDYMITYYNYYSIDNVNTKDKYKAVVELYFDAFISYICDTKDISSINNTAIENAAQAYLLDGGMTRLEVAQLISYITK